jgi:hypothetical protein
MANLVRANSAATYGQAASARSKQMDVSPEMDQEIVRQGVVPRVRAEGVAIPAAPKGEQVARGFGAMLRPQKYTVS